MPDIQWATTGTVSGLANNQQGNAIAEKLGKMLPSGTAPTTTSTGLTTLSGLWWHDTSNNQIKVRDQADTTWIVIGTIDETGKLFTAAASGVAAVQGARKNLKVDSRTGSAVITADEIVLETTSEIFAVRRSVSVTANPATSGANGLDTGTLAANTWYSVWVIYNGTTTAALLSTSATAPTMPSGYSYKARVGWVRSNATPALLQTLQMDRRTQYVIDGTVLTDFPLIQSGSTGGYTAKSVATFVPSTATVIWLGSNFASSSNDQVAVAANSSGIPLFQNASFSRAQGSVMLESTNIYVSCQTNASLRCTGWEDNL